jgi:tRNA-modifying protein YgfZ
MNAMNDWQKIIELIPSLNTEALTPTCAELIPMENHCILQVSGVKASQFLQGQVTCDVLRTANSECFWGAHCNHKGRMIGSFLLAGMNHETLFLRVRSNIADQLLKSLAKYAALSKVNIDKLHWVLLAFRGDAAMINDASLATGKSSVFNEGLMVRPANDLIEFWLPPLLGADVFEYLKLKSVLSTASDMDRYWIDRGIAEVQSANCEQFIPQMFNFDLIDGISFKKGCYTGQEIVARMQYRGQLKKHTYAMMCDQPLTIAIGDEFIGDAEMGNKAAATVVASTQHKGTWRGLVVANYEERRNQAYLVEKNSGAKLTWTDLPYAIPNSES